MPYLGERTDWARNHFNPTQLELDELRESTKKASRGIKIKNPFDIRLI